MFWFYDGKKKTSIRTRMSSGVREIDSHLINCMAKEVRLRKDEFLALVECRLSGADYLKKMKEEQQIVSAG